MSETATNTMIDFELVSPERKLIEEPVKMAVIPGEDGEFGVGAGHCSIVSSLKPGVVSLYNDGSDEPRRIFVAGGFADVTANLCTILAEEAIRVSDLNQQEIEKALVELKEDLSLAEEELDQKRLERKIVLLKAKLQAVTGVLQV